MRVYDQGSEYRVAMSEREVLNFNRQWPCSHLDKACSFTFDKRNGDLIDTTCNVDGSEVVALSQDAQEYGATKLGIETARVYDYQGDLSIYN